DALWPGIDSAGPFELRRIGRPFGAIGIDEVEQRTTNAVDSGHVERLAIAGIFPGAQLERPPERDLCINDPPGHAGGARALLGYEGGSVRAGLAVDHIIDVA